MLLLSPPALLLIGSARTMLKWMPLSLIRCAGLAFQRCKKILVMHTTPRKVRVPDLVLMKERGERIVMLTAYDATMARLFDRAGVDLLLVGDSLGNVILGLDTTIPVTLDAMIHHTRAVTRGTNRALVVADMPFLTYQVSPEQAMQNAARLFQEGGAAAVKLEGS